MQTETALGEKLKRSGFIPREVRFSIAIAEFLNNGGTVDRAHQLIAVAADKMELPGQNATAQEGQAEGARQPNGDVAGQLNRAESGHFVPARPSPAERERGGHTIVAPRATVTAPPAREPSKADRHAARAVRRAASKVVLDLGWIGTDHIPGGPMYVDLRVGDLIGMARRQFAEGATHGRSAYVCMLILNELEKIGQFDPQTKWVDVLPPEAARRISKLTEAENLKPMVVGVLESFNPVLKGMIAERADA